MAKALQIIFLAPAILSLPFIVLAPVDAILELVGHTMGFAEATLTALLAAGILAGLAASVIVMFSDANYIRTNTFLKTTVPTALALGIVGGCSVLIWIAGFIEHDGSTRAWVAICSWAVFIGPPVGLLTYQFFKLVTAARSGWESEESSVGGET